MPSSPGPEYVEHGGELTHRHPFAFTGARLRGFLLAGSQEQLQALCDRHFNAPSGGATDFRPLSRLVLLTYATLPRIASLDERDRRFGWSEEVDVAFWVPLLSTRHGRPHLSWFLPYVFVDNPYAMAAGREIYGFPKALGTLAAPEDPGDPDPYTVDTMALRHYGPRSKARAQRLFSIERTDQDVVGVSAAAPALLDRMWGLRDLLPMLLGSQRAEAGLEYIEGLLVRRAVPLVFLRQLRDVADPRRAAFQEIVEAPARLTGYHGGGLLPGRYAVRFEPCASHPIAQDLGLDPAGQPVLAAFHAHFDFVMDKGQRLWHAETAAEHAPRPAPGPRKRRSIAILGGGPAALAAAFSMTEDPDWQDRLDITVYQMGWRLGGKGASGRNPDAAQRIEEHGLHIWLGFYENAFRMIRRCYEEMDRPPGAPLRTWRDAFAPHSLVVLQERAGDGWRPWVLDFPQNGATPGDGGAVPPPSAWVRDLLGWTRRLIGDALAVKASGDPAVAGPQAPAVLELLREAPFLGVAALLEAGERAAAILRAPVAPTPIEEALPLSTLREARDRLRAHLEAGIAGNDAPRRLWISLDLALTALIGILTDDLLRRGFEAIDGEDFIAWLRRHGAAPLTLNSGPVRAIYDLTFAFAGGRPDCPDFAAGVCLRGLLRMLFTYKGAFMWKMQAGMGDAVFAPLYEVLHRRGVHFRFFHRVESLGLSADGRAVESVRLTRQATPLHAEYAPLIEVKGLPCWPDRPLYDQLAEGEALRRGGIDLETAAPGWPGAGDVTLRAGHDFDAVVLGIPLGALPQVCGEIIARKPAWQRMVREVKTTCTQAVQLWLRPGLSQLGWDLGAGPVQTAYAEPLDTWADMSHLLPREDWPADQVPGHLAYFCGPLPEGDAGTGAAVSAAARRMLDEDLTRLWPAARAPGGGFAWDLLVDPAGRSGPERLLGQYVRANVEPGERYVLSVAGSPAARLRAEGSGLRNLYLAGDWIDCGLNAGCVEAAVMAGMQCCRALTGHPEIIEGEPERLHLH